MTEDLTPAEAGAAELETVETVATVEDVEDDVVGLVISDGAYSLLVADFNDTQSAWEAYETLKSLEDGVTVKIDGVVVVKRENDGKLTIQKATDHSTKKGLKWGIVGGAALGLIFPPSILGSAAVVGAIGAASGKVSALHQRGKLADELEKVIVPGHSGLIALVSDPGVVKIRRALDTANMIVATAVDDVEASEIKAAAKAAKKESKA
ncbi:MAG: DUF1269 domain-containing protein [Propionicimonas sp.]